MPSRLDSHLHGRDASDDRSDDASAGQRSGGASAASGPTVLSRAAVRRVDAEAMETFGIPGIVLMENAARAVAVEALAIANAKRRTHATIFCGPGNNGGDGYAAARHLHNAGLGVTVVAVGMPRARTDAAMNLDICRRMGIAIVEFANLDPAAGDADADTMVIDALLGTGLDRAPEGALRTAIERVLALGDAGAPVVAIDLPSGLDADTGEPLGLAVRATCTVTLVAAKPGLLVPSAATYTGRLVIADIGVPKELVARLATRMPRRRGPDADRDGDRDGIRDADGDAGERDREARGRA